MQLLTIDISGIALQGAVINTINNVTFSIEFQWVERAQRWFISFLDEAQNYVISGVVLEPSLVLNRAKRDGLPRGVFYATRFDAGDEPFTRDNLSDQLTLWFDSTGAFE